MLGKARDWDVFMLASLPTLLEKLPAAQKGLLRRRTQAARRRAHMDALRLLAASHLTGADLLGMHRWLNGLEAARDKSGMSRFARKKLAALHRSVLAAAEGFAEQTPEQRHRLRMRVKRLRYALDYLGGLFGGHKKFAACFAQLQDELGELNDANTALRFRALQNQDKRIDEAVVQAGRSLDEHVQIRLAATGRSLRKFSRQRPPWQQAGQRD